jgi:hypothetical protein
VLYAFTAVDSLASHSIDQLDDLAPIDVEFRSGEVTAVPKERRGQAFEHRREVSRVVPMLEDGARDLSGCVTSIV